MKGLVAVPADRYLDEWPESAAFVAVDAELYELVEATGSWSVDYLSEMVEWPDTENRVLLVWEAIDPEDGEDRDDWLARPPGRCRLLTLDEWAMVAAGKPREVVNV